MRAAGDRARTRARRRRGCFQRSDRRSGRYDVLRRSQRGRREARAILRAKCVKSGGPVGIVSDGKAYLVVGEHKPMNDQLAEYCGKTITLKGKMAERGGIAMIENAEIVKK